MLDLVEGFDIIECEGEWEALLMESRLIKDIPWRAGSSRTSGRVSTSC
jgi:hypothetical protein